MSVPARKVNFTKTIQFANGITRLKRKCNHAEGIGADDFSLDDHKILPETSPSQSSPGTSRSSLTPSVRARTLVGDDGVTAAARTGLNPNLSPVSRRALPVAFSHGEIQANAATPQLASDAATRPQSSRFVGDLNPEGMFMEAAVPNVTRASSQKGDVGIWFPAATTGQPSQFITSHPPPIMDSFMLPFVREHCLTCMPPEDDYARLKAVFLQKVHPIFPVIPEAALNGPTDNPANIVLRQLACLAAGSDPEMTPFLRLKNKGIGPLRPAEFSTALSSSVRAILETSIIPDRVIHIQALTMLSLYTQPTCAEESDLPAQLGGRAIHHIQTLGLHLLRYDGPNFGDLENLFCAVWALDRINAAMYGRPCLIHERDIGADLDACIKKRQPAFRLLLSVAQWLDKVVELYRPGPSAQVSGFDKVAYIDLPVLEAMIVDADALKVPASLIATIETFYHAVIILSCRLPRPGTIIAASTLPPPSANARRSLAAERIACAVPRDCLSSLPFIPYAVSLALSVEYRKMRHSRLPMFRARAMNAFRRNCDLLRVYGDHFWSARVVAGLGERVLREMERAANTLAKELSPQPAEVQPKTVLDDPDGPALQELGTASSGDTAAINSAAGFDNVIDFSLINAISGQDVFGHIDPNFNLDAVEDALEANLDIGLPLNWGDWGQFAA
ncbi:fungal specific transcription factor [Trichoderma arundinaceum]|uniref:Fungal specific transcription factor n=1 Tax=Trichoderma arundinaceum TaxID=490622 RepID=A0A395NQM4_TRIAR|nr:fungal specific transcription factor [Trichoderma arundinaceum]